MQSTIKTLIPGKSFQYKQGKLAGKTGYGYKVTFEDGTQGEANSLSNPPPWNVGDMVEYEATAGQYGNKLAIKKLGGFTAQIPAGTTQPAAANKPTFHGNGANIGARTGMAINCAVQWLKGGATDLSSEAGRLSFQRTAVFFLHLAEKLEGGATEATKPEALKPTPAPAPPAQQDPDDVPF